MQELYREKRIWAIGVSNFHPDRVMDLMLHNEALRLIGAKYNKGVARVILRWLTQREVVAIPKSVARSAWPRTFPFFDFSLSPEDMADIASLDTKQTAFFDRRDPESVKGISTAIRNT